MVFKKTLSSMSDYHHTVTKKATPFVEFTKWCSPTDNGYMENEDANTRRTNLRRLIDRDFLGNLSAIARAYNPENPKPSYFSDLLREGSGKSFGEKAARGIETIVGLIRGQLDIRDSPLLYDESRRNRVKDELRAGIDGFDGEEQRELLEAMRRIQSRRGRRKAS